MDVSSLSYDDIEALGEADPIQAVHEINAWISAPDRHPDEQVAAYLLLVKCHRVNGDLGAAADAVSAAAEVVESAEGGVDTTTAVLLVRAAGHCLADFGRPLEGLELCRRLAPFVGDEGEPDLLLVQAALYRDAGTIAQAQACADRVRVLIDDIADSYRACRLLNNQGVLALDLGNYAEAEKDLGRALELAESLNMVGPATSCRHNIGVALARQGQIHRALALFDEAASALDGLGDRYAVLDAMSDRVAVLLDCGLTDEARASAQSSAAMHEGMDARHGMRINRSLQSRIEVADGNWVEGAAFAASVVELLVEDGIDGDEFTSAVARHRLLEFIATGGAGRAPDLAPDALGYDPAMAVEVGLVLAAEDADLARSYLGYVAEAKAVGAAAQLHRAVAAAELARLDGDSDALKAHVQRGLSSAESNEVCLGATDLRTMALRRVRQLSDIGVRHAIAIGDATAAARLLDRVAALALYPEPGLTGAEEGLIVRLRELAHGDLDHTTDPETRARIVRERARVENALRSARRVNGAGAKVVPRHEAVDVGTTGTRVVLLRQLDDRLVAVIADAGDHQIVDLGPAATFQRRARSLLVVLDAVAAEHASAADAQAPIAGLRSVLAPILRDDADAGTAIVSAPGLPPIPWALLTTEPITYLPSAFTAPQQSWVPDPTASVHVVLGPHLAHADQEFEAISAAWPNVTGGEQGERATIADAVAALVSPDMVHFSAHGRFRRDNPLFSEVLLADGRLTLYDFLGSSVRCRHVVFAACDIGREALGSSLGAYAVLRDRGCVNMVAAVGRLRDASMAAVMGEYYQRLADGVSAPRALCEAQRQVIADDPSVALLTSFGPS